ncbi:U6 small nuclear RNA (adenine-(43)-N(6))-methyltransferase [Cotesia glomerata]|uniref:U6 small nuclear RNA (adenine-(43)-N(6))-methyltransferase n=1 Tax=Cotesia glomerata TaxID=32391 RepID=A0AAV7IWJ9_COTGL|nr:U6 small nuclear RNA (adenine-(43)-N(6))-methyltransferase [Cotesia glomerata]XP_044586145.1 U6 small nuclear RNA (adenine-(43)-N(6))-methyltransferase [Cotesia glomerata]KAH0561162.1 hypothetical protein KQX54_013906 [Cotesia glomerata]
MSLKSFIHPRNKYKDQPNFIELSKLYPEFQQHVSVNLAGKVQFNFSSEESLRVLTQTLLKHDFDLDVNIPPDKLVPALTLRLNYVLWIEDLMNFNKINEVTGIDVGTGAIAIYPLLCSKIYDWKMIGSDIDSAAVTSANENIQRNKLDHLIKVIKVQGKNIFKDVVTEESYAFTMCNPPFFDADDDKKRKKRLPPTNAKTGHAVELSVAGGEKSFVRQMLDESLELNGKIKIYTTMLGQKNSLAYSKSELRKRYIDNFTWTEFCQGKTKRWGLAWSLIPKVTLDLTKAPVIREKYSHITSSKSKDNSAPLLEVFFPFNNSFREVKDVIIAVKKWIDELHIEIKELKLEDIKEATYELCAYKNTWIHGRRKRRAEMKANSDESKRLRVDDNEQASVTVSSVDFPKSNHIYLKFNLVFTHVCKISDTAGNNHDGVNICMILNDGHGGKNGLETFKQCLINKFRLQEYQKLNR